MVLLAGFGFLQLEYPFRVDNGNALWFRNDGPSFVFLVRLQFLVNSCLPSFSLRASDCFLECIWLVNFGLQETPIYLYSFATTAVTANLNVVFILKWSMNLYLATEYLRTRVL
ncbi:hypothetical protein TSAR_014578 [Trichomalopsis sarcophagae]|uniref:Uncharacterized protein n=1 Tax=Trichomalopsis sarcophagae TaxID=543379 RepID=A0A232EHH6_9HYME|nr:hypothetical protein TSAR_014578 [Trichomalopsis sarcophagae]